MHAWQHTRGAPAAAVAIAHPPLCHLPSRNKQQAHTQHTTPAQTPSGGFKYSGGEYFNESVPADARYADFLYKLTEKFKTAVSVKYQCPGEEMDPTALITVADDDDFTVRSAALVLK